MAGSDFQPAPPQSDSGRWENGVWLVEGEQGVFGPHSGLQDAPYEPEYQPEPVDVGEYVDESQTRGRGWIPNFPSRWEIAAYVSLFSVALLMRLYDLGTRAVHHDESLHGVFANNFANGEGYIHNPLMHGPFLFHSTAASFFLFGSNDFTLRIVEVLFGSALILVPLLLRHRLGNVGALLVAGMLAFSPTMLYFSRFARNDIFMAVWTLALVGVVWRYMDEKQTKWLYAAAALMALGFTTKETQFIVVALVGLGLLALSWKEIGEWIWGQRGLNELGSASVLAVVFGAMTLPMLGPFSGIFQDTFGITLTATEGTTGLATGEADGFGVIVALVITGVLVVISFAVILKWNFKIGLIVMAIFWLITFLLFTSLGTNLIGITS
ncbi:MAG: TIGR03663 family protein, partial [Pirellulaceae bacterium]|nr:TIGR03663 family protein [Pirellulaceae bacterium]